MASVCVVCIIKNSWLQDRQLLIMLIITAWIYRKDPQCYILCLPFFHSVCVSCISSHSKLYSIFFLFVSPTETCWHRDLCSVIWLCLCLFDSPPVCFSICLSIILSGSISFHLCLSVCPSPFSVCSFVCLEHCFIVHCLTCLCSTMVRYQISDVRGHGFKF